MGRYDRFRTGALASVAALSVPAMVQAQVRPFDVPRQPANSGVSELARQADIQVLAREETVRGKVTNAVRGMMSPAEAVQRLVRGTGIAAESVDERTYTLSLAVAQTRASAPIRVAQYQPASQSQPAAPEPAQTSVEPSFDSEDIVVTAQFRQQNLQETPLSITAMNGEMLDARGYTSVVSVAAQAPNVTLSQNNPNYGSSMIAYIRGVGQDDPNFALEPGVGIYLDDVYLASLTGTMLDLVSVDRVEVLRGPQGTLAGKNSIGGAIKVFSTKPGNEPGGFVEVTAGSASRLDARANVSFPIVENALFMSIAGVTRNQNGYIKQVDYGCQNPGSGLPSYSNSRDCKVGTLGDRNVTAGRIALRFDNDGPIEINIAGDYIRDRSNASNAIVTGFYAASPVTLNGVPYDERFISPDGFTVYSTFMDPTPSDASHPWRPFSVPPINHLTNWGVYGTLDWDLGESSLKWISAYRKFSNSFSVDYDSSPMQVSLAYTTVKQWQLSQELRFNGSIGSLVDYTVGGFYLKANANYASRLNLAYSGDSDFLTDDPTPSRSIAGFAQAIAHVTPKLDIIAGYRWSQDKKSYGFVRKNPDGTDIAPPIPVDGVLPPNAYFFGLDGLVGRFKDTRSDYRLSATYRVTDDHMMYAQFSTGYKGGGINPRPYYPSQVAPIRPEDMKAYEIGVKSDFLDRRVRLNMAAFFNDYRDIQLTTTSCDAISPFPGAPCYATLNTGRAHVKGFEVETTVRPVQGLLIDGTLSYLDFQYKDVDPSTGVPLSAVTPYTSKWRWSLGAQYEVALGNAGVLIPRIDAAYQSLSYSLASNEPLSVLDGRTLANARLTWRLDSIGLEAALEVTNLTNKYYYLARQAFIAAATASPGAPRRYALSVKKRF